MDWSINCYFVTNGNAMQILRSLSYWIIKNKFAFRETHFEFKIYGTSYWIRGVLIESSKLNFFLILYDNDSNICDALPYVARRQLNNTNVLFSDSLIRKWIHSSRTKTTTMKVALQLRETILTIYYDTIKTS